MGRGNVCVFNEYEGLYYIDNDDLHVYRNKDQEDQFAYMGELTYSQLTSGEWEFSELETEWMWEDTKDHIISRMIERFPSFQECDEWLGSHGESKAILENRMFYIAVEDNQWSMAIELLEKEDPWDRNFDGLKAKHYQTYLDGLKEILFEMFDKLGVYGGAWTSGTIYREENVA